MSELRVLIINGSPRANGNTSVALREMETVFAKEDVVTETVQIGNLMKSIALGREQFGVPEAEPREYTNFIR